MSSLKPLPEIFCLRGERFLTAFGMTTVWFGMTGVWFGMAYDPSGQDDLPPCHFDQREKSFCLRGERFLTAFGMTGGVVRNDNGVVRNDRRSIRDKRPPPPVISTGGRNLLSQRGNVCSRTGFVNSVRQRGTDSCLQAASAFSLGIDPLAG